MERTRFNSNHALTEMEKCLASLYQLSMHIPEVFKELYYKYNVDLNLWATSENAGEEMEEMISEIKLELGLWYTSTNSEDIVRELKPFKGLPNLRPALIHLKQWTPPEYKYYLESDYKGLPVDFAVPTPFLVMEDTNTRPVLMKPLIRSYGKTMIEIRGIALRAEDGQLTYALLLLMSQKDREMSEKTISFSTTREEIAEILGKRYPRKESTRKSIWLGLTRLNDCRMTLTNANGLRTLGGILSGARELEEDSSSDIRIHLDLDFVKLLNEGYTRLDKDIYFSLSPTMANLYLFLQRQMSFNTMGVLNPTSIFKIYEYAGLGGINPDVKPDWYKRKVIRLSFEKMRDRGIITNKIVISGGLISIVKGAPSKEKSISEKQKSLPEKVKKLSRTTIPPKIIPANKSCRFGHQFGIDYNSFNTCNICSDMEDCQEYSNPIISHVE